MADETELAPEELEAEHAEALPDREAMSIVDLGPEGGPMALSPPVPPEEFPSDNSG